MNVYDLVITNFETKEYNYQLDDKFKNKFFNNVPMYPFLDNKLKFNFVNGYKYNTKEKIIDYYEDDYGLHVETNKGYWTFDNCDENGITAIEWQNRRPLFNKMRKRVSDMKYYTVIQNSNGIKVDLVTKYLSRRGVLNEDIRINKIIRDDRMIMVIKLKDRRDITKIARIVNSIPILKVKKYVSFIR